MTEKEIVQFFINQNNQMMGWFIAILIGVFSILLVIFGYIQWRLSNVKIEDLKNAIDSEYHLSKIKDFDKKITSLESTVNSYDKRISYLESESKYWGEKIKSLERASDEAINLNNQLINILNNLTETTAQNQQQVQAINQNSLNSLVSIYVTFFTDSITNITISSKLEANQLYAELIKIYTFLQIILNNKPNDQTLKSILTFIIELFIRLHNEKLASNTIDMLKKINNYIIKNDNFKKEELKNEYQKFKEVSIYFTNKKDNAK